MMMIIIILPAGLIRRNLLEGTAARLLLLYAERVL